MEISILFGKGSNGDGLCIAGAGPKESLPHNSLRSTMGNGNESKGLPFSVMVFSNSHVFYSSEQ